MKRTFRLTILLGLAALAAAFAASAATILSPVHPVSDPMRAARLASLGQEGLEFDAAALAALRATGADARIENFPVSAGVWGTLVLKRFDVLAPGARITVTGKDGESSLAFPSIAHFSGKVEGDDESAVYVGAQEGRLVAYVRSSAGMAFVGPDESGSAYVVRSSDSPLATPSGAEAWSCGAEQMPAPLAADAGPSSPVVLAPLAGMKQAAVRIETDQELLAKFPGPSTDEKIAQMGAYVATLFGAINVVYERDLVLHLTVVEVHAWTTTDPYDGGDTLTQLYQLGDWWHPNRPMASYPRAFVHYLSGRSVSGGIAWLSVLCNGDFFQSGHYGGGYGLTQVYGTYPLQFWDQFASAHEMGHNAGSPHTHCYNPPIDECYSGEPGCYSGPTSVPPEKGTIMSYCHLLPGGYNNIVMKFHARCISEKMMPEINGAACLTAAGTFEDVPPSNLFYSYVETLAANGVTSGCSATPSLYCPNNSVSRAQMAVFLLKSKLGSDHVPPAATGSVFLDVPANAFAAAWIEELAGLGVTGGCGGGNYCPGSPVTRAQMSAFLLKALSGSDHVPPAASSVFADVPDADSFEPWIMELYDMAVTGGCATSPLRYCPANPVTRGQMAPFLVKTFNLQ
jgi:hypothetical protein